MAFSVFPVHSAGDLDQIRVLFREYEAWLDVDLSFQGFEEELVTLPGKYASPQGALFLAKAEGGRALGCVGVRPFDRPGSCELKRLYVRPESRGSGAGLALAREAIAFAAARGYREMLLDTLPKMTAAISLYRALGFEQIPPYWHNVLPGILYFGRQLRPAGDPADRLGGRDQ